MQTATQVKPLKGLNLAHPSIIAPEEASAIRNLVCIAGVLSKRGGYFEVGITAGSPILGTWDFLLADGTRYQLRASETRLHRWNGAAWVNVTAGALSGTYAGNNFHSVVVHDNLFLLTSLADDIKKWDGTSPVVNLQSGFIGMKAKFITSSADRVVVANITESGTRYPTRVRWSTTVPGGGDWTGTGAGAVDRDETPNPITGLAPLSDLTLVYKESEIWAGVRTGRADNPFQWVRRVSGSGLYFPRMLCDLGTQHLVVGRDSIYLFDGSARQFIDQKIRDQFFRNLNMTKAERMFSQYHQDQRHIHIYVVEGLSDDVNACWTYHMDSEEWTRSVHTDIITCAGFALAAEPSATWDTVGSQSWNSQTQDWDGAIDPVPQERVGTKAGSVMAMADELISDNGVGYDAAWESGDSELGDPLHFKTLYRILITYITSTGVDMTISVKADNSTWFSHQQVLPQTSGRIGRAWFDFTVTGYQFRMKIELASDTNSCELISAVPQWTVGELVS